MQKIELELDEQTLERARQLTQLRQTTLEEWLKSMINQLVMTGLDSTLTAWEMEKTFIRQRIANSPSAPSSTRSWTREDIYNARFAR